MLIAPLLAAAVLASGQPPAAASSAAPAGTARVSGVVVAADSGAPVARVAVRLARPGSPGWMASTDAAGRFEITGLPAGRFSLTARRPGFVTFGIGQAASRSLHLDAGQALENVTVRMVRGGAIEGRILDEHGEPIVEAAVRALRTEYVGGSRRLSARHSVQTDDRGRYRLYGLPPGKYYVAAAVRSVDLATYDPRQPPEVVRGASGLAPTFYPGTAVAADAAPIVVRAAEDVAAVDFALTAVRLARVSGVVVDSRGRPAAGVIVMLNAARSDGAMVTGAQDALASMVEPRPDGSFVIANVTPGEYRLDVQSKAALEAVAQSGRAGLPQAGDAEYASRPLTVSGEDVEGLRVVTGPGVTLSGRVTVRGAAVDETMLQRLRVSTFDLRAGHALSAVLFGASGAVRPDGSFDVHGVSGTRAVRVHGLPAGWALHAVLVSGVDVTDEGIEIRQADVRDVEVVVTAAPARVTGTVLDGVGRPVPEATVVVFPQDRTRWPSGPNRHIVSATSSADGSFTVSPLPAGDYFIAVVEGLAEGEWAEPETLEQLSAVATRIKLGDGETRATTLRTANPEPRTPNPEPRTPNPEPRTPSAERRPPGADRRLRTPSPPAP